MEKKWTGQLGPRQLNAFKTAVRNIRCEGDTHDEVKRDRNGKQFTIQVVTFAGDAPETAHAQAATAALDAIGEKYQWTLSALNCKHVVKDLTAALERLKADRPTHRDAESSNEAVA